MSDTLEALLQEGRTFPPPEAFRKDALDTDASVYDDAERDWQGFWAQQALDARLDARSGTRSSSGTCRSRSGSSAASSTSPYNCLDRHVDAGHGDQVAFYWEGEPGDTRAVTYRDLLDETCRVANALRSFGVEKGDRVAIYMGMVPETVAAMLACARIGAPHSVVFGGFTAQSLRDRINDARGQGARSPPTARGGAARSSRSKDIADEALAETPSIEHVLVLRRTENDVAMQDGRDVWWHDVVPGQPAECACEEMDSEDLLYLLYTSGTTGKPKGIMHTTGGYLTQVAYTHKHVFDLHPDTDVYWCTADVGWVTGHSYIVYGPLANRTTSVLYEGTPDFPDKDRFWSIVEKYKVTTFYTAPTAIRTFMKWGDEYPGAARPVVAAADGHRRRADQPRSVGLVLQGDRRRALPGRRHVVADRDRRHHDQRAARRDDAEARAARRSRCPASRPASSTTTGKPVGIPGGGYLVLERPWPSMLRGIWGDPSGTATRTGAASTASTSRATAPSATTRATSGCSAASTTSCSCRATTSPRPRSSPRSSTTRRSPKPRWSGKADDTTGQAIAAFVILRAGVEPRDELVEELRNHVAELIGPIAKPKSILFTEELPKTRSGKIMRRLLRDVARGPGARRHHDARRPRGRRRHQVALPRGRAHRGLSALRTSPSTGPGAPSRSCPARRSSSTSTACSPTRRAASTTSSRPASDWRSFFDACGEDRGHRRGADPARPARPRPPDRAAHRPARTGSTTSPRRGSAATRSAGTC